MQQPEQRHQSHRRPDEQRRLQAAQHEIPLRVLAEAVLIIAVLTFALAGGGALVRLLFGR